MATTTFHLLAVRRYGDPAVGDLLARMNPELALPEPGDDIRLPRRSDLLARDVTLGGATLPATDETAAVIAAYFAARAPARAR